MRDITIIFDLISTSFHSFGLGCAIAASTSVGFSDEPAKGKSVDESDAGWALTFFLKSRMAAPRSLPAERIFFVPKIISVTAKISIQWKALKEPIMFIPLGAQQRGIKTN